MIWMSLATVVALLVCCACTNVATALRQQTAPAVLSPSVNATYLRRDQDPARYGASLQDTSDPLRLKPTEVVSYSLDGTVFDTKHDPLEQVIDFILWQEEKHKNETMVGSKNSLRTSGEELPSNVSFLEVSAETTKVHAFCEICILIMQMKERGQPHLCAGLNPDYFISCVENLESLLRADKAVVYWLRSGCMHLDREGPEIVRPCPAHAICAWVPNLFADVGIVTPRNELSPLCPRDFKYLPRIPRKPVQVATIT